MEAQVLKSGREKVVWYPSHRQRWQYPCVRYCNFPYGFQHGNPWECVGNNRIPCGNPCESAWGEIVCTVAHKGNHMGLYVTKFPTQEITKRVSFINPRRPTRSPSWVPTRVISSYTVPYAFLYGSPCKKFCPTLPDIGSHVSFIYPPRPTRSPLWFPVWRISSHTVPYGFLYGSPCRKFRPILAHMGSGVSLINPRRPTRSRSWVATREISSYTVPYSFLYASPCRKFRPILPHTGSRVSFINPRRRTRSPLLFPVWGISSHTVPYAIPCWNPYGNFQ